MPQSTEAKAEGVKILVVDDEPAITVALTRKLRRDGYECLTAGSAEEALNRLASQSLDIVITDVRMPGMSGIDLLKEVKRQNADVQVILVTAYADVDFAVEALRNRADDYLLKPFNLAELDQSVSRCLEHRRLLREQRTAGGAFEAFSTLASAIESRDHHTNGHVERVVRYALATGAELGVDHDQLSTLRLGALLHDVGKLKVSAGILNKPGPLTAEELQLIHEHPAAGESMIAGSANLELARPGVLQHHERWDGSGYPLGVEGEAISLEGRVIAVADAFDAVSSDRPYRPARSQAEALTELDRCTGTQFDPNVAQAFIRAHSSGFQTT